jgi:CubicO group peptidase (beta-lactamase class C family)
MTPRAAFIVLAAILASFSVRAPAAGDRYEKEFQPLLEVFLRRQEIPGLAIAIVENNQVVYARGFGRMSLGKNKGPVTPLTVFHMASIVKPFVATAILQLADQHKVELDAAVVRYLPYFRLADPRYHIITVRQMVAHTSGMSDVTDYEWDKPQFDEGALERYVRSLSGLNLLFEPGLKFAYSNIAYDVLGDVIAKTSGESFEDYVQHRILTPLKMTHSTLLYREVDPHLLSDGHVLDSRGSPVMSKAYPYNRTHSPSSNLHSNALDMTRWAMANMNHGELEGQRILPASIYAAMWKPTESVGEPAVGTHVTAEGISWFVGSYRGHFLVTHSGGDLGFITDLAMLPEKKIAVVWMANCDWIDAGPINGPITFAALDTALGLKPEPITLKRSLVRSLYFTYSQEGIATALGEYRLLKNRHATLYDFSEGQLREFGKLLMGDGQAKAATQVFRLNAAAYPHSARARRELEEAKARVK